MNESVKAQFDVRVNLLSPYLTDSLDSQLIERTQALIDNMRDVAEASSDASSFEEALNAGPLNAEYGLVYSELMKAANGRPSAKDVLSATAKGISDYKRDIACDAAKKLAEDASQEARLQLEDAWLDATRDDYRAAKAAARENPLYAHAETASNVLSSLKGLKGLFGRKK